MLRNEIDVSRMYALLPLRSRLYVGVGLACVYAFALSLQFLAQPFVWRNFPIGEVIEGWVYVFRDRLIVAVSIALAVLALTVVRSKSVALRASCLAVGVIVGAVTGELIVGYLSGRIASGDTRAFDSLLPQALRWSAIAFAVSAIYYVWRISGQASQRLRDESLRHASIEQQLINTRLTALKSQIEPHFLFNTLATLRRLHHVEPASGAHMLASFIDYLHRVAPMLNRSEVPLGEELELVQAYLSVIQMRMQGRLETFVDVPDRFRNVLVPPLALATLVENAVKHGITPATAGGKIEIRVTENNDQLHICVADTGVGLNQHSTGGTGIGLSNVRSRLVTLYGDRGELRVESNEPHGVRASIQLPCRGR